MSTLYEKDFCEWTCVQACRLRKGEIEELDIENLIEEIEDLGRSNKSSLSSYLVRLMTHLLKMRYAYQQKGNSKSWESSILGSRYQIKYILRDSPSLKNYIKEVFKECYQDARELASLETCIREEVFPKVCPWTIEEVLNEGEK